VQEESNWQAAPRSLPPQPGASFGFVSQVQNKKSQFQNHAVIGGETLQRK
jgi:hypothetical protein